jgi:glycosyltransferase involved in cell wall biosynthesis
VTQTQCSATRPRPIRLGAYAPSPVYNRSGLYRRIAADPRFEFTVIFSSSAGVRGGDLGYGHPVSFDADALSGFESVFLRKAERTETDGLFTSLLDLDVVSHILRRRFDVLWMHGYYSATHLLAAATQIAGGRRLLVREEQTLLNPRPAWKRMLKKPLLRLLFTRSTGMYIGTRNREWFRYHGMPETRLFHVPFCVDNEFFRAEADRLAGRRNALRAAFGIPPDAGPVVLSVARLVPTKQPLLLLEAFRRVRERHRCALLVVGTGACEPEMRAFVHRTGLRDVFFAGFLNQSEISRAYSVADLLVLASANETWGLVVNEAMNFGLPVVASDRVGCAADLVRHGDTGLIVRHDSVAELTGALCRLVADSSYRVTLGCHGAALIDSWNYEAAADGVRAAVVSSVGRARWQEAESALTASGELAAMERGASDDGAR